MARCARRNRALKAAGSDTTLLPPCLSDCAGSALAVLAGLPRCQFFPRSGSLDSSSKGALDLFSGSAGVARGLTDRGSPWVLIFDIERSPNEGLDNPSVQKMIELLLRAQVFLSFGASPPCSSFSRAVHPPWRSCAYPRGLPGLGHVAFAKVTNRNRQADCSFMWLLRGFEEFAEATSSSVFRLDQCRFGARWRKRTRFAVPLASALAGERLFCVCARPHLVLRGRSVPDSRPWTAVAQAYPRPLAELVCVCGCSASWMDFWRASTFADSFVCLRGRRPLRPAFAESKGWDLFLAWVQPSESCLSVFAKSPALLAMALRAYTETGCTVLCKTGGSIHDFRHTILGAQRCFLSLKPWASQAWELVTRWEHVEPVQHRMPIPEPILKALVALAWLSGFFSFAAVTLLSFYGLGRIGEVLPVLRSDLLLPSDDWWNQSQAAFLTLRSSKTMHRRRGRIQHMKITDARAVSLLEKLYGQRPGGYRLFPQTPSAYRYRWNKLLETLSVPPEARLTPGGLRGGGAVQSYRSGVAITEIQWRMRLRHLQTLEFYLQEVGAASALASLSQTCASKVRTAGTFYEFL